MQQTAILYPLLAMTFVIYGVGIWLYKVRMQALKEGTSFTYFKLNRGEMPAYALQAEQHFANLFETPVLFYVIGLLAYMVQQVDIGLVLLAWSYVGIRIYHAWIHLGQNKLLRRRNSFASSISVLLIMWLWVFGKILLY